MATETKTRPRAPKGPLETKDVESAELPRMYYTMLLLGPQARARGLLYQQGDYYSSAFVSHELENQRLSIVYTAHDSVAAEVRPCCYKQPDRELDQTRKASEGSQTAPLFEL